MFKLSPLNSVLSMHITSHAGHPPIQRLEFDDDPPVSLLYSGGDGQSAIESSLAQIANPIPFIRVNPNDEIHIRDPRYQASGSPQINQAISNLYQLIDDPVLVGLDFPDIRTTLIHPGQGASVFGYSRHSARRAARRALQSLERMKPPAKQRASSFLAILRGCTCGIDDFTAVCDTVSDMPFMPDDFHTVIGVIHDRRFKNAFEVNFTAIWQA